jgi:branched-chain amino acid transport system permease protein
MIFHLLVLITLYSILSISLNLAVGVTGLFNLGHAAFFGIGAYTSALLSMAGVPFWLALLAGVCLASLIALLIGLPTLRLVGDYLAVATMGLGEIARAVFKNWVSVTRGPMGLPGIPDASLFGFTFDSFTKFLGLSAIFLVIVYILAEALIRSPFGRVLKGIREDEMAVQALGKNTFWFKMWSLVISAGIAGLAGSLFAHYMGFIDPSSFGMWITFFILLIIMLGGLGNNLGAVVGAVIFVVVREGLRFVGLPPAIAAPLQQLLFGVLLIVMTIFAPRGLIPERKAVTRYTG